MFLFTDYLDKETLITILQTLTPLNRDLRELILEIIVHKLILEEVRELFWPYDLAGYDSISDLDIWNYLRNYWYMRKDKTMNWFMNYFDDRTLAAILSVLPFNQDLQWYILDIIKQYIDDLEEN